jgi:prepilin-type processing-associated H-X9-DG protein
MKKHGSALINWLVVAAMLVIVAAIVLPIRSRDYQRALAASCLSNVKQIGLGVAMYATDYDNKLPLYDNGSNPGYVTAPLGQVAKANQPLLSREHPDDVVGGTLLPYIKNTSIMVCAADPDRDTFLASGRAEGRHMGLSYALNGLFLGVAQDEIVDPKDKIFMIDECSISDFVFLTYTAPAYNEHRLAEPGNFMHFHGLNCLYADGHAKWMSEKDWPETPASPGFWRFGVGTYLR